MQLKRSYSPFISWFVLVLAAVMLVAVGICRGKVISKNEAAHHSTNTGGLQPGSPWPMLQHDPQHTGRGIGGGAKGVLMWKYRCGDEIDSDLAISSDGTIFVGSDDGNLYAINHNGTLKWKYQDNNQDLPLLSNPAIGSNGSIYVFLNSASGGRSDLYALKPNCKIKWWIKSGNVGSPPWSPVIGPNGTIYTVSDYLIAFNPKGVMKWKYNLGGLGSVPAIGSDGTIYTILESDETDACYLYAIKQNGTVKWKFKTHGDVSFPPTIGPNGSIYVELHKLLNYHDLYYLFALKQNGTLKWEIKNVSYPPAFDANGTIYYVSNDGYLYAINAEGTLKWKFYVSKHGLVPPAIGKNGTIYVGSDNGYLYAIK